MKREENVTNTSFVSRGLKLCAAHWKWLTSGLVCLMANVAAQLIFPNYQGKLIDQVVKMDREGFKYDVMMVLYLSIATGAFAAVRQFSFRMVGTKMTNRVRNQLFSRLLSLDVVSKTSNQANNSASLPPSSSSHEQGHLTNVVASRLPAASRYLFLYTDVRTLQYDDVICFTRPTMTASGAET